MDMIKMGEETSNAQAIRSQELVKLIEPLLAGKGPEVQGAVLVDLVATWLAGHHPNLRATVLAEFMVTLVRLAAVNEKLIFGDRGFPKEGVN
jgi:hypothetical protein